MATHRDLPLTLVLAGDLLIAAGIAAWAEPALGAIALGGLLVIQGGSVAMLSYLSPSSRGCGCRECRTGGSP